MPRDPQSARRRRVLVALVGGVHDGMFTDAPCPKAGGCYRYLRVRPPRRFPWIRRGAEAIYERRTSGRIVVPFRSGRSGMFGKRVAVGRALVYDAVPLRSPRPARL